MLNINPAFWQFVDAHMGEDANKLRLKYHGRQNSDFDIDLAITQIECRRRFGKKLSETLTAYPQWLFANTLSGEQSTSDRLAAFHARLIDSVNVQTDGTTRGFTSSQNKAEAIADLTAGLGIDALHLSRVSSRVYALEIDKLKAEALHYNFTESGNVEVIHGDCRDWLQTAPHCDCMFIDPARRAPDGSRVYALSQCQPDVTDMMSGLAAKTDTLVVKLSPMLDITQTFRDLPQAHTIISIGTETECRELIALIDFRSSVTDRTIQAVTLKNDGTESILSSGVDWEGGTSIPRPLSLNQLPSEGMWLYDPYPAVMKAGPYQLLCELYRVQKPSPNTHLYFSDTKNDDFPGLCLQVERVVPFNSKYIKRLKNQYPKINVITRNFDMSADKLRQKLGVTDGSSHRLYAITCADGQKLMIIAK